MDPGTASVVGYAIGGPTGAVIAGGGSAAMAEQKRKSASKSAARGRRTGPLRPVQVADLDTARSKAEDKLKRRRISSLATRRPLGAPNIKTRTLGGA